MSDLKENKKFDNEEKSPMKKKYVSKILLGSLVVALCGCAQNNQEANVAGWEEVETENSTETENIIEENVENITEKEEEFRFVDAWGEWFDTTINPNVEKNDYDWSCLKRDGDAVTYEGDSRYSIKKGVDVSHHQGTIDWEKVKAAGYEFAFVRMAYQ